MLTFRKALVIAIFVMACLYLFRSSHSTPRPQTPQDVQVQKSDPAGKAVVSKIESQTTVVPTGSYGASKGDIKEQQQQSPQKPIHNPGNTLVEKLQYQYPYDPEGKFPAYIWQTWKNTPGAGEFDEKLRPQEASWTMLHPGFVHEVITDDVAANLIRLYYASVPEVVEAYNALPVPVLKADFFRYLILLARGGIYSDIDTTALKSATDWLPKTVAPASVGLIVGIEADPDREDWADWYSRRIQFCQWTIQAKVGHPVLRNVVAQITAETLRMKKAGLLKLGKMDKSIVEFTGPARWTDNIFAYFNNPSYFRIDGGGKNITWEAFTGAQTAKRVGDVVVLPITSFSPGVQQMGAKEPDDPMAFVKHDFEGGSLRLPFR